MESCVVEELNRILKKVDGLGFSVPEATRIILEAKREEEEGLNEKIKYKSILKSVLEETKKSFVDGIRKVEMAYAKMLENPATSFLEDFSNGLLEDLTQNEMSERAKSVIRDIMDKNKETILKKTAIKIKKQSFYIVEELQVFLESNLLPKHKKCIDLKEIERITCDKNALNKKSSPKFSPQITSKRIFSSQGRPFQNFNANLTRNR